MHFTTLFSAAALSQLALAGYVLQDDYMSGDFYDNFDFFTAPDPTHGFVQYVDQAAAQSMNLLNASAGSGVGWGVDTVNKDEAGRASVRLTSKKIYNHGLVVIDVEHMPVGCGTWPAFWMVGPNWPNAGEIDIIEGVHEQESNSITLHTGAGCAIGDDTSLFSGEVATPNCDIKAPGQGENQGCSIGQKDPGSYGAGLNSNGGGVFATEWTSEAISVWFIPRGGATADALGENPDPSSWGKPAAQFVNSGCEIDSFFKDQQIVFDTTFCGDWAGRTWGESCAAKTGVDTCNAYVRDNPDAFTNAFWTVNALKVYTNDGSAAPKPSSPATPDEPTSASSSPSEPTDAPTGPTDAPTKPTDAPTDPTDAPSGTDVPSQTDAPAETDVPSETDAPTKPTDAPTEPTDAPTEPTDAPTEPTDAPTKPTDAPVTTDAPSTEQPTDAPAPPSSGFESPPIVETSAPAPGPRTRTRHGGGGRGGRQTQQIRSATADMPTPTVEADKGAMGEGATAEVPAPTAKASKGSMGGFTWPASKPGTAPSSTGAAAPVPTGNSTAPITTKPAVSSGVQSPSSAASSVASTLLTSVPAGVTSATVTAAAPTPTAALPVDAAPVGVAPVDAEPVGAAPSTSCTKSHPHPTETAAVRMARHARDHRRRMVKHHARK